jgi:hypothetical protein
MRYIVAKQPDQTWCVFDRVFNVPAQMGGVIVVGLSHHAAEQEASKANLVRLRWMPTGPN